ncbi:hypothetical protein GT037_005722 [Alternaria burnsii]|uniref:Heterokaryon incompatibility domain-containing protein n=1 Tax=Alternaria burnsii TaxID=1187904 RepID=A0A8H7B7X1_9PLEO|nr:uncharacterized protein GT037_005722 [Alternaria burnsii]KAF7676217.1 hypothetical protein GT037_005722 [Alternaria burnsii]
MRLLRTADLTFHEYEGSSIPPYAILLHRWEGEEVKYQDFKHRTAAIESKSGFGKIQQCCQQAQEVKIKLAWVDTCCIDKSSSAELSEAINSMYQWYQRSQVCYVYLSDVGTSSSFRKSVDDGLPVTLSRRFISRIMRSKWWTRGWTLQELIAPVSVVFYVNGQGNWVKVGSKSTLLDLIVARTSIQGDILRGQERGPGILSPRKTSRSEDLAYCLLGLFGVNMPLLYGEATKAFLRLQEEIMKQPDDQTLFAWQLGFENMKNDICGPLALHPSKFWEAGNLQPDPDTDAQSPYSMTNKGLRIELSIENKGNDAYGMAILHCGTHSTSSRQLGLPVIRLGPPEANTYARDARYNGPLVSVTAKKGTFKVVFMKQEPG